MKDNLLGELYDRAAIVAELNGPQVEAWVSGLFPLFDDNASFDAFVSYCVAQQSERAAIVCLALAELTMDIESPARSSHALAAAASFSCALPPAADQIGASSLTAAWRVDAPFGRTIVLGFENTAAAEVATRDHHDEEIDDARHSILIEVSESGELQDLQLTGPPRLLLNDAAAEDDQVRVVELDVDEAIDQIVAAWPTSAGSVLSAGSGVQANQQFVRRRLFLACGRSLPAVAAEAQTVDITRGLNEADFFAANQAARSTLQAAVGSIEGDPSNIVAQAWAAVIRGDAGELSARERDGLIWLEWADWLGVGIGLIRAGEGSAVSGEICIDLVNRCPEVSSTIDKKDRAFAEWAFEIALDLLQDCGAVEGGSLSAAGYRALGPAMLLAWGD